MNVAGVEMAVTAYVTGIGVTYDLLLSRRWMEAVGAAEDYEKRRFTIRGNSGKRVIVAPTPSNLLRPSLPVDYGPGTEVNTFEELEEE